MDLRLHGPFGAIESRRHLRIAEPIHVAEHDGTPIRGWEGHQSFCPGPACIAPEGGRGRTGSVVRRWVHGSWLGGVERQRRSTGRHTPPDPGAAEVQHDCRQPRPQAEIEDAPFVVSGEGAVRPDEGILRGFLGVTRIAEHPERDRIEPILVGDDEPLEGSIEIPCERGYELAVSVHRSPEP